MPLEVQRRAGLTFVEFDPARLGIVAWPLGGSRAELHVARDAFASHPTIEAVLDGPMPEPCSPPNCRTVARLHLDRAYGVWFPGTNARTGMTIAVLPNGQATAAQGDTVPPGATAAVQGYPSLVWNGANVADPTSVTNSAREWRSALAILSNGKLAFVVGVASMYDFAEHLRSIGATYAVYTDGSGSSSLGVREAGGAVRRYGHEEDRPVATWLVVERKRSSVALVATFLLGGVAGWLLEGRGRRRKK